MKKRVPKRVATDQTADLVAALRACVYRLKVVEPDRYLERDVAEAAILKALCSCATGTLPSGARVYVDTDPNCAGHYPKTGAVTKALARFEKRVAENRERTRKEIEALGPRKTS